MMTSIDRTHRSPSFSHRRAEVTPRMVVIHSISMDTEQDSINLLLDEPFYQDGKKKTLPNKNKVSAHYVITKDGTIYSLVDEEHCAWHAGESFWRGTQNLNDCSIGIELTHDGDGIFSDQQMDRVASLCHDIVSRWRMDSRRILAHSDIAPLRKKDPGEHFDWRYMAHEGLGIMPSVDAVRYKHDWRFYIQKIGYETKNMTASLRAFQRHFMMMGGAHEDFGKGTSETLAALDEVWRKS